MYVPVARYLPLVLQCIGGLGVYVCALQLVTMYFFHVHTVHLDNYQSFFTN